MNEQYTLLIIGNIYYGHIQRFIKNLKNVNKYVQIDVLSVAKQNEPVTEDILNLINNVSYFPQVKSSGRFSFLARLLLQKRYIHKLLIGKKYDFINIHYPTYNLYFSINDFEKASKNILITPWGSDVYRTKGLKLFFLKKLFKRASYICCNDNRFGDDLKSIFKITDMQAVKLDIGSETIDYINKYRFIISQEEAKISLGYKDKYVITCGYNASEGQQHKEFIRAVSQIRNKLPNNILLVFPLTYPSGKETYISSLKELLDKEKLDYLLFTDYLTVHSLFLLRQSTDLFVHIQVTDANSASILEYLLCEKKILNGSWLKYKELCGVHGVPYFEVDNITELPKALIDVASKEKKTIDQKVIDYIVSYGWEAWSHKWNDFFIEKSNNGY